MEVGPWPGQNGRVATWSRNESSLCRAENAVFAPRLFCDVVDNRRLCVLPRAWGGFNRSLSLNEPLLTRSETNIHGAFGRFGIPAILQEASRCFLVVAARAECLVLLLLDSWIDKSLDSRPEVLQTLRLAFDFKRALLCVVTWTWHFIRVRVTFNQILYPSATRRVHLRRQFSVLSFLDARVCA